MGTMLSIYVATLLFGGFFVAGAVLGGMEAGGDHLDALDGATGLDLHDADALAGSLHLDLDTDLEALPHVEISADHVTDLVHTDGAEHAVVPHGLTDVGLALFPVFSFRFWTFGSFMFGLTGVSLTLITSTPWWVTLGTAGVTGAVAGSLLTNAIRRLARDHVSSSLESNDYPGSLGRVMVTIPPGGTGKVRCTLKGQITDLLAETDEKVELKTGTQILVLSYEEGIARVVHADRLGSFVNERGV